MSSFFLFFFSKNGVSPHFFYKIILDAFTAQGLSDGS